MKLPIFSFLLVLVITGCTQQDAFIQPNTPAKYSITFGVRADRRPPSMADRTDFFGLLTTQAKICSIACQSIVTDSIKQQITFNIIGRMPFKDYPNLGIDFFIHALSDTCTLGFWDMYRNTDEEAQTVFRNIYNKIGNLNNRLSYNFPFYYPLSPTVSASVALATTSPENIFVVDSLLGLPEFKSLLAAGMLLAWSYKPVVLPEQPPVYEIYAIKKSTEAGPFLTGHDIKDVYSLKNSESSYFDIDMEFKREGSYVLAKKSLWASKNGNREIGILIDGRVILAPRVTDEITSGVCNIAGDFTLFEAMTIVNKIKLGSLPYRLGIVNRRKLQ